MSLCSTDIAEMYMMMSVRVATFPRVFVSVAHSDLHTDVGSSYRLTVFSLRFSRGCFCITAAHRDL